MNLLNSSMSMSRYSLRLVTLFLTDSIPLVMSFSLLGVKAVASGRNDITVDGKKVSGNAFYRTSGRSIVHGTMLFDTNLEDLVLSITPNNENMMLLKSA